MPRLFASDYIDRILLIALLAVFTMVSSLTLSGQTSAYPLFHLLVEKQTGVEQSSPSAIREKTSLLVVKVSTGQDAPLATGRLELRGSGVSIDMDRVTANIYEYTRPYANRAAMEQALPDGVYQLITGNINVPVTISTNAAITSAVVTNFDALQRWTGSNSISVTVSPTPQGQPDSAVLSVSRGSAPVLSGSGSMQSPATTVTTSTGFYIGQSNTAPGEVLGGQFTLLDRRVGTIGPNQGSVTVKRVHRIDFPVARSHLPPQIITPPSAQTVDTGTTVTFAVTASGNALSYLWLKDSLPIVGATDATLTLPAAQPSENGSYSIIVSNTGGSLTSSSARLTVNPAILRPDITSAPRNVTLNAGDAHTLSVTASGSPPLSYQWFFGDKPLPGGTNSTLVLASVRPSQAGEYSVKITNSAASLTSLPVSVAVTPVSRIANLSIRAKVGGSSGPLALGVTIGSGHGSGTKPLLIRAAGPTLGMFGVESPLIDPQLAFLNGVAAIAQNDDWSGNPVIKEAASTVGAFPLMSDASKDAALAPAAARGGYTIRVMPAGNTSGIALAEVYDATPADVFFFATPRMTNASALTEAGNGADALIAGFSIAGVQPKTVLIRGVGPALSAFGVGAPLSDPKLDVQANGAAAPFATNDNWSDATGSSDIAAMSERVGAFALPVGSKDAALLLTLAPGSYTAQISGVNDASGTALVEIYEVP
jgi:hypothetical protein